MMIIASYSSHASQNLWLSFCFIGFVLMTFWSSWSVRRGKPAIPKHIQILVPLALYLLHLQWSLPYTYAPSSERTPDELTREESNHRLRRDLDRAIADLDQLNATTHALLNLAWLAGVYVVARWLGPRLDDRNWIHGGIRPPPSAPGIPPDHSTPS